MCRGGVTEIINTHTKGHYGEAYVTITKQDFTVTERDLTTMSNARANEWEKKH